MSQGFVDNTNEEASFHPHSMDNNIKSDSNSNSKPLSSLDLDSILKSILQPTSNTLHDTFSHHPDPTTVGGQSNASSRRHSVALGELDLHGIDPSWFDQPAYPVDDLNFTTAMAHLQQYSQQQQQQEQDHYHFPHHRRTMSMQQPDHFISFNQHHQPKDTQAEFHPPSSFVSTPTTNDMMMNLDLFHPPPSNDIVTPSWLLSTTPSTTNDSTTSSSSSPPLQPSTCATSDEPKNKRQKKDSVTESIGLEPMPFLKQEDTILLHHHHHQHHPLHHNIPPSGPPLMTPDSLRSFVQRYISERYGERTVILLTSRVAQKSYGTEKR